MYAKYFKTEHLLATTAGFYKTNCKIIKSTETVANLALVRV